MVQNGGPSLLFTVGLATFPVTANLPSLLWCPQPLRAVLLMVMLQRKGLVKMGSPLWFKKEGGSGGGGFKYVVLHLGLLSKCALFNSQTKHRESIQIREKTLLLRVCKISFLPIALLWQNLQRLVCSQ